MRILLSALGERVRGSLFFVPLAFVIAGIVLAQAGVALDAAIGEGNTSLPFGFSSTVESARAVLGTIAGATITVAGIAFSVSLLTIQLASSQYSPRVVSGLFKDPFNKRVIGLVVGTFTYCLVVLRAVRAPLEQDGQPVIPNVSVAFGLLLGIVAVLAIVAFINHNAHSMDISEILDGVTRDATAAVDRHWVHNLFAASAIQQPELVPQGAPFEVRSDCDGWIQLLDHERLLEGVPEGSTLRFETAVGRYLVRGAVLASVWPPPPDPDAVAEACRASVRLGHSRTLQQDASYGIRQLVDVALKALSPGVNDPTTARDAIWRLGSVLRAFLQHDTPARDMTHEQRRLILACPEGPDELVALAFDELRLAAAPYPDVVVCLLETISTVADSLDDRRRQAVQSTLDLHARLIVAAFESEGAAEYDRHRVRAALTG